MSNVVLLFAVLCVLFLTNSVVTVGFARLAKRWNVFLDLPHTLSTHRRAIVRGAGISFVLLATLAWIVVQLFLQVSWGDALIFSSVCIALLGFFDDLKELRIRYRLTIQILAGSIFLLYVPVPDFLSDTFGALSLLWYPCALFFLLATTNLYNFMDGVDGMVGLHSVCLIFAWLCLSVLGGGGGAIAQLLLCLLAAPLLSFLILNWNPAKVFMGDAGSTYLGFVFGAFALVHVEAFPRSTNFIAFVFLMMPFLFDTTFTILVRLLNGKKCHVRHRDFLFHKLVLSGVHQKSVATVYAGMTLYNGLVLILIQSDMIGATLGLPLMVAPYLSLYSWTTTRRESPSSPPVHLHPAPVSSSKLQKIS